MNIASPFNYVGGKFKLLDQLLPLFPSKGTFLDLFAGGATVSVNSPCSKIIINDIDKNLIDLLKFIYETPTNKLIEQIDKTIESYNLSNSRIYGRSFYPGAVETGKLARYNKPYYIKMRADFNNKLLSGELDCILLYVLIVFSFNNQINYNKKGLFNMSVGGRDFNSNMRKKIALFSERLKEKEVQFTKKDFRAFSLDDIPKDTFIYCDPPYLITDAVYNAHWTTTEEMELLDFLEKADAKGFRFALSNLLVGKNRKNSILSDWIARKHYNCYHLNKSYTNCNYHRIDRTGITDEVLITN